MTTAEQGPVDAELRERAAEAVRTRPEGIATDPWRLAFHVQPPVGLLNDPNGLVQHDGTYHLCYQWHPFATAHALKFWAHLTSTDLVHWTEAPIALAPSDPYDRNGCYSGSAIVHDGAVHFVYTGNVRGDAGQRYPYQNVAVLGADGVVTKHPVNPVISHLPGCTPHQRDPKVWRQDDRYWMVLGAQTDDLHGTALLLTSEDLLDWQLVGPIAGGADQPLGYMWECPDLLRVDGADVLVISPQLDHGPDAAEQFQDVVMYAVGALDLAAGRFTGGDFRRLDAGPDFYAPQSFVDESGRTILVAWMGMPDHPTQPPLAVKHPTVATGWVHCLTVPRVVRVDGDEVLQWPVAELDALRGEPVHHQVTLGADEGVALDGVDSTAVDLVVAAEAAPGALVHVRLREGAAGAVVLTLDPHSGTATLDRSALPRGEGGAWTGSFRPGARVEARILADHSSVEVFVDGGRLALSARIYPDPADTGVSVHASGGSARVTVTAHPMAQA